MYRKISRALNVSTGLLMVERSSDRVAGEAFVVAASSWVRKNGDLERTARWAYKNSSGKQQ